MTNTQINSTLEAPEKLIANVLEGSCAWSHLPGRHIAQLAREEDWGRCLHTGCLQRVRSLDDGTLVLELAESTIGGTKRNPVRYLALKPGSEDAV